MKKQPAMFRIILLRSLQRRWPRLLVAVLAMLLGALLVSALASLQMDMGAKVGKELRSYGANLVVSARDNVPPSAADGGSLAGKPLLSQDSLAALDDPSLAPDLAGYVPYLYGVVQAGGRPVILAGAALERVPAVNPWWKVSGQWVTSGDRERAMIGSDVARQLGLSLGQRFTVEHQGRRLALDVAAVVDTGAAEDSQVFVNLAVAQEFLERPGAIGLIQASALTTHRPLADIARAIERSVPGSQVKIIGQIADAESSVFQKIQLLMALVAALVLIAAALSVTSTMTTSVLERTREIGLLKALGAGDGRIAAIFLAESAAIGLFGGLLGYLFGLLGAHLISQGVFQTALSPHWLAIPLTVGISLVVALVASIVPVRRATAVDPAISLRGD